MAWSEAARKAAAEARKRHKLANNWKGADTSKGVSKELRLAHDTRKHTANKGKYKYSSKAKFSAQHLKMYPNATPAQVSAAHKTFSRYLSKLK